MSFLFSVLQMSYLIASQQSSDLLKIMGGGACQFLRRKCAQSCIFAPYFSSKQTGSDQFRAVFSEPGTSYYIEFRVFVMEKQ